MVKKINSNELVAEISIHKVKSLIEFINKNRWAMLILTIWIVLIIYFIQGGSIVNIVDLYILSRN